MSNQRWVRRPRGSNWGDFGADDQLGRINLIGPEARLRGAREILTGESFCLSLPLDVPRRGISPYRKPPRQGFVVRKGGQPGVNYPLAHEDERYTDLVSDDRFELSPQYSTHWDALAHTGSYFDSGDCGAAEPVYYNGFRAGKEVRGPEANVTGAAALGIDQMAAHPVQTRGLMLDIAGFGPGPVTHSAIEPLLSGLGVQPGDILCLHTGLADAYLGEQSTRGIAVDPDDFPALDGRDARLLDWISDSGLAAIAADNIAVETYPSASDEHRHAGLPLHEHCLFKLGLPLGELWHLTPLRDWLANEQRRHFHLTCPPLRLPRAFGSPVTPIATV